MIPEDEFSLKLDPHILMGYNSTNYKMVLSKSISNEYMKHASGNAKHRFICADCGSSFHHFHILSNHIQMAHILQVRWLEIKCHLRPGLNIILVFSYKYCY